MMTEKEWRKRGSNPKHTAPSPIGMQVIDAIRAGGFRIWNGNCENLNPEDEVELSKLIEKESGITEMLALIGDLKACIELPHRHRPELNVDRVLATADGVIQKYGAE